MADLPPPPVPSCCDVSDIEPPWDLFIEMAVEIGGPRQEVEAFMAEEKARWRREHQ